jgi:transposase
MSYLTTVVGLDVHKDSISAAVLQPEARSFALTTKFCNEPGEIRRFVARMARFAPVEFVYEAGPCGYHLHRQLTALNESCTVIAPSLIPRKPGDRVKTDRRDAEKLAQLHRAGQLTPVRVPTREDEAARDLTRVREDALVDRLRARHRMSKFLLRQGLIWREKTTWGVKHRAWIRQQRFDFEPLQRSFESYLRAIEEAEARLADLNRQVLELAEQPAWKEVVGRLRCLKGIDTLSALILAVEAQDFGRFAKARQFMGFSGLVSREDSSGNTVRRGHITKAGNAHIRRVLVEAAWNYGRGSSTGPVLAKRREGCALETLAIARRAQERLSRKFRRLVGKGKRRQVVVVSVARELAGFVWAIGRQTAGIQ